MDLQREGDGDEPLGLLLDREVDFSRPLREAPRRRLVADDEGEGGGPGRDDGETGVHERDLEVRRNHGGDLGFARWNEDAAPEKENGKPSQAPSHQKQGEA